ncbi:MAG: hypothetical protein Q7S00_06425 [bacterium]|nr:hypothetical protein [bacterium]
MTKKIFGLLLPLFFLVALTVQFVAVTSSYANDEETECECGIDEDGECLPCPEEK